MYRWMDFIRLMFLGGVLLGSGDVSGQEKALLKVGVIADIQYGDIETAGTRFYRNSLQKLESAVAQLNSEKVDFSVNLGDLTDRRPEDLDPVLSLLNGLSAPVRNTTGNHDYVGITDNAALYKKLGMPSAYYSFEHKDWVFVMLNTNEVAAYSNVVGTDKEKELTVMLDRIQRSGRTNGKTWNGGISAKQMKWLSGVLKSAGKKKKNVLVFSHHPLYPAEGFTALNDKEILETLARYSCVRGVISGHHHVGALGTYKGITCITTEGMVETAGSNAFAVLEIYSDRFVLRGEGRSKTHEVELVRTQRR
jgi:manganese-dependent ADP-ribose/CDP-alcohol diphosphatase